MWPKGYLATQADDDVKQKELIMTEQANDTLKTIHSLRTTHGDFSDRDISNADLETVLSATVRAANASNAQNYAIIVIRDRAVMKEVSGAYSGAVALLFCVDYQRNMDLAAHLGKAYEYDPAWALTTGAVDAALAAQTAVIAAQSLGIDSLLTNGIHRGDPRRVWKALDLPRQNCFPAVMLILGYGKSSHAGHAGRLGAQGTIHHGKYHRRNAAELGQLATFQSDAANMLWEPKSFFDGPGKRAKTAYAQLASTLTEAGFALPTAPVRKE
jgi:nitroreductase